MSNKKIQTFGLAMSFIALTLTFPALSDMARPFYSSGFPIKPNP